MYKSPLRRVKGPLLAPLRTDCQQAPIPLEIKVTVKLTVQTVHLKLICYCKSTILQQLKRVQK